MPAAPPKTPTADAGISIRIVQPGIVSILKCAYDILFAKTRALRRACSKYSDRG